MAARPIVPQNQILFSSFMMPISMHASTRRPVTHQYKQNQQVWDHKYFLHRSTYKETLLAFNHGGIQS